MCSIDENYLGNISPYRQGIWESYKSLWTGLGAQEF